MSELTESIIRNAEIREKRYTLSDGRGLILEVDPNGSKYWVVRLYKNRRETRRGIGTYPAIKLKEARKIAFEMKNKQDSTVSKRLTFGEAYEMYDKKYCASLAASTKKSRSLRYDRYIKPKFANVPINDITTAGIADLCQEILTDGKIEVARRVHMIISQVFDFAVLEDFTSVNPADYLTKMRKFFPQHIAMSYAAVTDPADIAVLLRSISAYPCPVVRSSLKLSAYSFCRPGEVRRAEWKEINFRERQWVIPAEKMKKRRDHIIPLTEQMLRLLSDLHFHSGESSWLFPSPRSNERPLSPDAARIALRAMGYPKEKMTAHGFRSTASSVLNHFGWPSDVIEAQLAHIDTTVRGIYNRTLYLPQRKLMMQWYNDYLDALRDNGKIPPKPDLEAIYRNESGGIT